MIITNVQLLLTWNSLSSVWDFIIRVSATYLLISYLPLRCAFFITWKKKKFHLLCYSTKAVDLLSIFNSVLLCLQNKCMHSYVMNVVSIVRPPFYQLSCKNVVVVVWKGHSGIHEYTSSVNVCCPCQALFKYSYAILFEEIWRHC